MRLKELIDSNETLNHTFNTFRACNSVGKRPAPCR